MLPTNNSYSYTSNPQAPYEPSPSTGTRQSTTGGRRDPPFRIAKGRHPPRSRPVPGHRCCLPRPSSPPAPETGGPAANAAALLFLPRHGRPPRTRRAGGPLVRGSRGGGHGAEWASHDFFPADGCPIPSRLSPPSPRSPRSLAGSRGARPLLKGCIPFSPSRVNPSTLVFAQYCHTP